MITNTRQKWQPGQSVNIGFLKGFNVKRLKLYKSSNVTFDPQAIDARSYGWWRFVKLCGNKVVFNNYRYSKTTAKHQAKVRSLLSELGIGVDVIVDTSESLDAKFWKDAAIQSCHNKIAILNSEISKRGSHTQKNANRIQHINALKLKIKEIKSIRENS